MANILVVDDEELVRATLRQMLESADHVVFEAANGKEALRSFENRAVDLVITDIIMPEKEGIETIIDLRKIAPNLRIVAISGGNRARDRDIQTTVRLNQTAHREN